MLKKKFRFVIAALFTATLLFSGCDNPNNNISEKPGVTNPDKDSGNTEDSKDTPEINAPTPTVTPATPPSNQRANVNLSSVAFAKELTIGWNLGNTLDAPTETGWGMPKTTKDMLHAVKLAGFKTIRIPVSWSTHVTGDDYKIDATWMNRVTEVVNWAIEEGFYVILNVHHDNYKAGSEFTAGFAISKDTTEQAKSIEYLKSVWFQIATVFQKYSNQLIFEVLNEPRCIGTSNEWGFYDGSDPSWATNIITNYETECIKTIRAIEGNENRYIMAPGYAGSGADSSLLKKYKLPTDTITDKLLLSVHAYSPSPFALSDKNNNDTTFGSDDENSLDAIFKFLKETYTDKGIGAVMGEASASNKDNDSERLKWINYYFEKAKEAGIPVVLWDNMTLSNPNDPGEAHGWLDRKTGKWYFPDMIQAMMDIAGVTGYSIPKYIIPTLDNIGWNESNANTVTVANMGAADWSASYNKIAKSAFANAKAGSIIKITFASPTSECRFVDNSWSYQFNSTEATATVQSGNDLYVVLTDEEAEKWKTTDISIVGANINITAVKFLD